MSEVVIKVENLGKQYRLGEIGSGTLSGDVRRFARKILGKESDEGKISENDRTQKALKGDIVWAVKDINFEVKAGEVLGIIGRNGAGKSTLLKLLSRVTAPTVGSIKISGRMASLLEVGTGFHPELTGRENVFLNGAIMGMNKAEIRSKFDEIVDFSGVERYIDTPVKRYSSGMHVRLGFAVAAHLEPEILVIDEVLAVGDSEFQKKCLGKMKSVSGEGRTVLFVSHNMAAIKSLCDKGLVLENGKIAFQGNQLESVKYYQDSSNIKTNQTQFSNLGNENIKIQSFRVYPNQGDILDMKSGVCFEVVFLNYIGNINLDVTFELKNDEEVVVFHQGKLISVNRDSKIGTYIVTGIIPGDLLNAGFYQFNIIFGLNQREVLFMANDILGFELINETLGSNSQILPGIIRPNIQYTVEFNQQ